MTSLFSMPSSFMTTFGHFPDVTSWYSWASNDPLPQELVVLSVASTMKPLIGLAGPCAWRVTVKSHLPQILLNMMIAGVGSS